jgi:hypothetical protein
MRERGWKMEDGGIRGWRMEEFEDGGWRIEDGGSS